MEGRKPKTRSIFFKQSLVAGLKRKLCARNGYGVAGRQRRACERTGLVKEQGPRKQLRPARGWAHGKRAEKKRGGLAEEPQQHLRPLIGQAQGLDAQLLANLQRFKRGAFLGQISIHQGAKPAFHGIHLLGIIDDLILNE